MFGRNTGGPPKWQAVYDLALAGQPDDVLTFAELSDAVGDDVRAHRGPVHDARRHLEKDGHRTLVPVPTKGYRIARADEHLGLARQHQRRSQRQISKALAKVGSADRSQLAQDDRGKLDELTLHLRQQAQFLRRLDARVTRAEVAQIGQAVVSAEHEERIKTLEEKLSRFGEAS